MLTTAATIALVVLAAVTSTTGTCAGSGSGAGADCRAAQRTLFTYFTTHTAYEAAESDFPSTRWNQRGCKPVQFWMLSRHGTRWSSADDIRKSRRVLPEIRTRIEQAWRAGRSQLCAEDYKAIMGWAMYPTPEMDVHLTPVGWRDQRRFGRRMHRRFAAFLGDPRRPDSDYKFYYDDSERTLSSGHAFFEGLRGKRQPDSAERSLFPNFYHRCPTFNQLKDSKAYMAEVHKFEQGAAMSATVERVRVRLGLDDRGLSHDEVSQMFTECGYERAWNWYTNKSSPWCGVFRDDDFQVLEYASDLRENYRTGYGWDLHTKLGCYGVRNLVETLKSHVEGVPGPIAKMAFSHDTFVNMFLAYLGKYKDAEPIRADNFETYKSKRNYRVSLFSPFMSNIEAVLYRCAGSDTFWVRLYLNENPLALPGCGKSGCSWDDFMKHLGDEVLQNCDIRKLCRVGNHTYPVDDLKPKIETKLASQ